MGRNRSRLLPSLCISAAGLALVLLGGARVVPAQAGALDDVLMRDVRFVLGIEIGTPVSQAIQTVMAAGYKRQGDRACYFFWPGEEHTHLIMLATEPSSPSCTIITPADREKPVVRVFYRYSNDVVTNTPQREFVNRLNAEIGSASSCGDNDRKCAWQTPAKFPKVKTILFNFDRAMFSLTIENPEWPKAPANVQAVAGTPFDPLAPIGDTDILAPGGVAIGMPLEKAHAGLMAAGYATQSYGKENWGCEWVLHRPNEVTIKLKVHKTDGKVAGCKEGAIIRELSYDRVDVRKTAFDAARRGADVAARAQQRLGAEASACLIDGTSAGQGRQTECCVPFPSKAPDVGRASMTYTITPVPTPQVSVGVFLRGAAEQRAIQDAPRPPNTPPPPVCPSYFPKKS